MKNLCLGLLLIATTSAYGQTIKFKVSGHKDTTVFLIKYFGKGQYYADTAEMKGGLVQFNGSKHKEGVLALYLPGKGILDFVYNNEEVHFETALPDMMGAAVVKKSEENKVFVPYVRLMNEKRILANRITEQRKGHEEGSEQYKSLTAQLEEITKEVEAAQEKVIKEHPAKLVAKIVKMSMDVKIPEPPKDEMGNIIDSNWRFYYFREHFFDNIDLKDDRLVRTPIFHGKLSQYFSNTMMAQHWDTVLYHAFRFCDQLDPKSEMFQYCVSWITSTYEKSKIMGLDKVFVMMGDRYYCTKNAQGESPAFWMEDDKLATLCEKVNTHKNLVMGVKPPNISLRDTTDVNWRDFYSLTSEYTILYFWDPECGHCKKITPKLQTLYEKKFRDRNIEIFAVGKAVGDDFEKWKKFIRDNHMEFINVAVTDQLYKQATADARQFVPKYTTIESLNYQQTYDLYATPKVFVLDKDKKIIAKSLTISQLEDLMDRLQGKTGLPKLFEEEEEGNQEDVKMH